MLNIEMPGKGEKTVYISPGEEVNLQNFDLGQMKIDILGPDFIVTNPATGAKLVFPGLGLILFSEADAPAFFVDGEPVAASDILSEVGIINNITQKDFLSFTSLETNTEHGTEDQHLGAEGQAEDAPEDAEEIQEAIQENTAILFDIATFTQPPGSDAQKTQTETKTHDVIEENTNTSDKDGEDVGRFTRAPGKKASSQDTAEQDETDQNPDVTPPEAPTVTFAFSAELLQTALTDGTETVAMVDTRVVRGGGGISSSAFDPSNSVQYSTEIIDTIGETDPHIIYADDPNLFSETTMARVVKISPSLPDGFVLSDITISGLPAGFEIYGEAGAGGTYSITDLTLDENGDIAFTIRYTVPATQTFDLTIDITTDFDPMSGEPTPEETSFSTTLTQTVEVKDVTASSDLNYTDGDGDLVWVLANNPNANRIFTGDGDATVYGGEGDDSINSFAGADIIYGGGGDDTISTGENDDWIRAGRGDDSIDGGAGTDTLDFQDITVGGVTLDLSTVDGNGFATAIINGAETDLVKDVENINGSNQGDNLTGTTDNNIIMSYDGNDVLDGGDGDDTLDGGGDDDNITGGSGDDIITGGAGNDTAIYTYTSVGITVDLSTADINGDVIVTVGAGDTDTLNGIENITGTTGNDTLTGDNNNNILNGSTGNDTLAGGLGDDTLIGGSGTDTVNYSAQTTALTLDLTSLNGDGYASAIFGSGETDYLSSIEIIYGTNFADNIIGTGANETIYANFGSDTLDGGGGTDTLTFSNISGDSITLDLTASTAVFDIAGDTINFSSFEIFNLTNQADTIITSTGDDVVSSNNGDDTFSANSGDDTLNGGGGSDTIDYSLAPGDMTIDLTSNSATGWGTDTILNFENIITGNGNDDIIGNNSANNIQSGDGDDIVQGRGGNDTLDGGIGIDTLDYSYTSNAINLDMGTIDGSDYFTVTIGSETDKARYFENIIGSTAGDSITGNSDDNIIVGGDGNDTFGYSGGNDTYEGDAGTNTLSYAGLASAITVDLEDIVGGYSSVTFSGAAGKLGTTDLIQNITSLTGGDGDDTIRGDSNDNTLTGNDGIDTLDGRDGADTLSGGNGNDILTGGTGDDTLDGGSDNDTLNGDDGDDTLLGKAGNDTLNGGNNDDDLNGGIGDDILNGGSGNDILDGGSDSDTIDGGAGDDIILTDSDDSSNDSYDGGADNDWIDYSGQTGALTIDLTGTATGGTVGTDTLLNIENARGGSGSDTITGTTGANELEGGAGNDTLNGGDGDDILNGGSGSNTLNGGIGTDTATYTAESNSIIVDLNAGTIQKISDLKTDTISSVENILGTESNDSFTLDDNDLANFNSIDANGGDDTVSLTGQINFEGSDLAGVFSDIEELTLTDATLALADDFDITGDDVKALTDGNDTLHITMNSGFSLSVTGGTYSIASVTAGDTTTYTFTSGADTVTLEVQTV